VWHTYGHKFSLPKGNKVFVPTALTADMGGKLISWIQKRWLPPDNFFHLQPGGHVAAARSHICNQQFLRLDLRTFFDKVTRSKVHRGLRGLGYSSSQAFSFACHSTVEQTPGVRDFSVPFGFPQSPILASLVLANSSLGRELERLRKEGLTVSVYVDDLLLSTSEGSPLLEKAKEFLETAALKSGFEFNASKQQGPSSMVTAFNINVRHGGLGISVPRMADFEMAVLTESASHAAGVIAYVSTVNGLQAAYLNTL
jgi:hypothetical protein